MVSAAIFNPNPRIECVPLSNGQSCLVIDDALVEPERWVEFAAAQRNAFRNVDFNAYLGIFLLAPGDVVAALNDFFMQHVRNRFDARRMLSTLSLLDGHLAAAQPAALPVHLPSR